MEGSITKANKDYSTKITNLEGTTKNANYKLERITRERDVLKDELKREKILLTKTLKKRKKLSKETQVDAHDFKHSEDNQLLGRPIGHDAHRDSENPHKAKDIPLDNNLEKRHEFAFENPEEKTEMAHSSNRVKERNKNERVPN